MILLAQAETAISATAAQAFHLLSNMERFQAWFPAVVSIESANGLRHGEVGKKYLETVVVPLTGKRKIELTVVDAVENQRFVTEGDFRPLLPRMEISISETEHHQIRVHWAMYSRSTHWAVRLLVLPMAKAVLQKRANVAAKRLKALLEQQPPYRADAQPGMMSP